MYESVYVCMLYRLTKSSIWQQRTFPCQWIRRKTLKGKMYLRTFVSKWKCCHFHFLQMLYFLLFDIIRVFFSSVFLSNSMMTIIIIIIMIIVLSLTPSTNQSQSFFYSIVICMSMEVIECYCDAVKITIKSLDGSRCGYVFGGCLKGQELLNHFIHPSNYGQQMIEMKTTLTTLNILTRSEVQWGSEWIEVIIWII